MMHQPVLHHCLEFSISSGVLQAILLRSAAEERSFRRLGFKCFEFFIRLLPTPVINQMKCFMGIFGSNNWKVHR